MKPRSEGGSLCPLFTFSQLRDKGKRKTSCGFEIHIWGKGGEGAERSSGKTEMDSIFPLLSSLFKEPPRPLLPKRPTQCLSHEDFSLHSVFGYACPT